MKSPAAERRCPALGDMAVAVIVAAAAVLLLFCLRPSGGDRLSVQIALNGELIAEYDLSTLKESATITLTEAPYPMTIELAPGRVRIAESSCPSQDCVHIGWISRSGSQIICLPNHLVVSLTGAEPLPFDAITG